MQLLLRKQVAALIQLWKLPVEFEVSGASYIVSSYKRSLITDKAHMQRLVGPALESIAFSATSRASTP